MKRILLTEKFTITTHLTPDRVEDKLLNFVEPYKSAKFLTFDFSYVPPSDKPYQGTVENGFFKIRKMSKLTNQGYFPIIQGSISGQDREGSIIEVKMKPDKEFNDGILLFPIVMTPIVIINFFCFLASLADGDIAGSIIFFAGPTLVCMGHFSVIKNFESNVKQDKQFLLKIFE